MSRRPLLSLLVLAGTLVLVGFLIWHFVVLSPIRREPSEFMKKTLQRTAKMLCAQAANFSYDYEPAAVRLPKGNTKALYAWVMQTLPGAGVQPGHVFGTLVDRQGETLRDEWGHELVYRFPAKRPEAIFDLYSVGPNGVDESGGLGDSFEVPEGQANPYGDDVTCVPAADWHLWVPAFDEGAVPREFR